MEDGVVVAVSVIVIVTVIVEVGVIEGVPVDVGVIVDVFSGVKVLVAVAETVMVQVSPGVSVSVIVCVKTGTSGVSAGVVGDCFLQEIMNTDSKQITKNSFFISAPVLDFLQITT